MPGIWAVKWRREGREGRRPREEEGERAREPEGRGSSGGSPGSHFACDSMSVKFLRINLLVWVPGD